MKTIEKGDWLLAYHESSSHPHDSLIVQEMLIVESFVVIIVKAQSLLFGKQEKTFALHRDQKKWIEVFPDPFTGRLSFNSKQATTVLRDSYRRAPINPAFIRT